MGGGTVLRSAAAKVAGIGSANAGLRGLPSSAAAATQSLVRNAAAGRPPSAVLSAQGGLEESLVSPPAAVQWNQWNIDDWEEVVTVVEGGQGPDEPMPRVVFGGAPSLDEAKAATNELKDAIDMVYLLKSEDEVPESMDSAVSTVASGAVSTYAVPNHAVQAFRLLSQNPAAQDVVASIASDPNVWNALLKNEALKDFIQSQNSGTQFPLMNPIVDDSVDDVGSEDRKSPTKLEEMSAESCSTNQENAFMTLLQNVKLTVVEMVSGVSSFIHNIFNPPAAEKTPANDESAGSTTGERSFGASLLGLVMMVIMVVLLKRV
ncbi:hypothetical protein MLD38_002266 [Melastoma candidum]|uniref:Uncharacterized protein n=1 Tax=Melastoma candidum TaxID=119954 RepID=A0ACB9SFD3_9MYRT|nr:hypothetical protein MLD38_002266 [Melastoma candidum]